MAPRRGGGYGGGGSSISCDSSAFETELSRIDIAFTALYFVVSVVLWIIAVRRFNINRRQRRPVAGAFALGLSIVFAVLYYTDVIVYLTIGECGVSSYSYYPAIIIANWLSMLSKYILVAVILTSICRKLQNDFGRVERLILTFQTIWAVLLGLLVCATLSISTAINVYVFSDDLYDGSKADDLAMPMRGVQTTYLVLSVAGIILASATMAKSLFHAPASLRSKNLTIWVILLIIFALGSTATSLGGYIDTAFVTDQYEAMRGDNYQSYLDKHYAQFFLSSFFLAATFYAALKVAAYRVVPGRTSRVVSQGQTPMGGFEGYAHQIPGLRGYNAYQTTSSHGHDHSYSHSHGHGQDYSGYSAR